LQFLTGRRFLGGFIHGEDYAAASGWGQTSESECRSDVDQVSERASLSHSNALRAYVASYPHSDQC
jgi:hypothetical protein